MSVPWYREGNRVNHRQTDRKGFSRSKAQDELGTKGNSGSTPTHFICIDRIVFGLVLEELRGRSLL
jgi:hypothetical protein